MTAQTLPMSTWINDEDTDELPEVESYCDPWACDVCGRPLRTDSFYCNA